MKERDEKWARRKRSPGLQVGGGEEREHRGLRRWGVDVRCSIKLCEDSVINPLKMSDCR